MSAQQLRRELALRTAALNKILRALADRPVRMDNALVSSRTALLAAVVFEHGEAAA